MTDRTHSESILSHGERDVAGYLRDGDRSIGEIAEARDTTETAVRQSVDRIREKTRRALVTLAESPFTEECARDLDPDRRRELLAALRAAETEE